MANVKKKDKVICIGIGHPECDISFCEHAQLHEKINDREEGEKNSGAWCTEYIRCSATKQKVRCTRILK